MLKNRQENSDNRNLNIHIDGSSKLIIAVILLVIFVIALALLIGHSVTSSVTSKPLSDIGYITTKDVGAVEMSQNSARKTYDNAIRPVSFAEYTVAENDSVSSIAQHFGISTNTLIAVNDIRKTIKSGDILRIPDRDGTFYVAISDESLSAIAHTLNLSLSWKNLRDLNGLSGSSVKAGQKLFIPSQNVPGIVAQEDSVFANPLAGGKTVGLFNQRTADPVSGKLTDLDGILIQTPVDSAVKVSANGYIIDKSFNDNGTIAVTVFHAGGYTTFYNYLSDVQVNAGDIVSAGTVLGKIRKGNTSLNVATLFYRIEHEGMALNPSSFF